MATHELTKTRGETKVMAPHLARQRLLAGLPLSERRVELAGAVTAVLEGGDGPPLVLLHGGIECGGVYWAPIVTRLARSYHLIVPDVPGLGESEPVARLDAEAFGGWLAALLRLIGDEKPALVAHSLVGSLATRSAALQGDRLSKLVIYGTPGIGPYRMPLGLLVAAILLDLRPTERNNERFERWALHDLTRTRRRDADWFDAFNTYSLYLATVPRVKRTMRNLIQTGTKQIPDGELRSVKVPTALLWGRHDRMVPLRLAEWASARLSWPLHVVEAAGHVPHIEQPEAFVRTLSTALA
jgi:pimeloyl-ACP methyl ester carboxylesterase